MKRNVPKKNVKKKPKALAIARWTPTEVLAIFPTGRKRLLWTDGNLSKETIADPDWLLSACRTHGYHEQIPFTRLESNANVEEIFVGTDPDFGHGKVCINMPATIWANEYGRVSDQLIFGPLFVFALNTLQEEDGLNEKMWPRTIGEVPNYLDSRTHTEIFLSKIRRNQ